MAKQSTINLRKPRRSAGKQKGKKANNDSIISIGLQKKTDLLNADEAPHSTNLVHQEQISKTDQQLRAFDLNYEFGPCVGIKRIDRWERAKALGYHPPQYIKDLLTDGDTSETRQESLFYQFRTI